MGNCPTGAARPPFRQKKLPRAIASLLATTITGSALVAHAQVDEVVVTATKREADLQEAAITVEALEARRLEEQHIDTITDYVLYLPNVNAGWRGPGQDELYVRGVVVDPINIAVAESQGVVPNVAFYLDEQPVSAGGRHLDVYVTDVERIEVLPGPQGTLYGASSQAGTIRIITNKPVLDEFAIGLDASTSVTSGGEPSTSVEAVLNLPLVEQRLAMRAAVFTDRQGGFIDNVESAFVPNPDVNDRLPPTEGIMFVPAGGDPRGHEFANGEFAEPGRTYPVRYTTAHNDALVEDDFNASSWSGARVGARLALGRGWEMSVQHHQQTLEVDGVFDYNPSLGDLEVARFHPDRLDDTFGQTSLTLEGRLGRLDLLYAGSFLDRETEHTQDYTEYVNFGGYIPAYICEYNTPAFHGGGGAAYTHDPTLRGDPGIIDCSLGTAWFGVDNETTNQTHEVRLSADLGQRLSFTGGVFYQDLQIEHVADWSYGDLAWNRIDPDRVSQGKANDGSPRPALVHFTNDITRSFEEIAVFGEVYLNLTDRLVVTLGGRFYDLETGYEGYTAFRYGSQPVPNLAGEPGVVTHPDAVGGRDYARNLGDFQPLQTDDFISKIGLSWSAGTTLIFATVSEGYRPPGFNRAAAAGAATAQGVAARSNGQPGFPDYFIPTIYQSDLVTSYEVGWKTLLFDRRLRFNGAWYRTEWDDIQVSHFDSQNISIFTFIDNAGDAEVSGVEFSIESRPTERLALYGAFAWNQTELTSVNPALDFFIADAGSALPLAPEFQATLRMRYEWELAGGTAFVQLGGVYADESFNSLIDVPGVEPRRVQDAWFIADASVGFLSGTVLMDRANTVFTGWTAELFVANLTDERAQLHISRPDFQERVSTARPRTIGLRVSYDLL